MSEHRDQRQAQIDADVISGKVKIVPRRDGSTAEIRQAAQREPKRSDGMDITFGADGSMYVNGQKVDLGNKT